MLTFRVAFLEASVDTARDVSSSCKLEANSRHERKSQRDSSTLSSKVVYVLPYQREVRTNGSSNAFVSEPRASNEYSRAVERLRGADQQ